MMNWLKRLNKKIILISTISSLSVAGIIAGITCGIAFTTTHEDHDEFKWINLDLQRTATLSSKNYQLFAKAMNSSQDINQTLGTAFKDYPEFLKLNSVVYVRLSNPLSLSAKDSTSFLAVATKNDLSERVIKFTINISE